FGTRGSVTDAGGPGSDAITSNSGISEYGTGTITRLENTQPRASSASPASTSATTANRITLVTSPPARTCPPGRGSSRTSRRASAGPPRTPASARTAPARPRGSGTPSRGPVAPGPPAPARRRRTGSPWSPAHPPERVRPVGARREHHDGRPRDLLDEGEVLVHLRRQRLARAEPVQVAPARQLAVDGGAVRVVRDAHPHGLEAGEHVELGEDEAVEAVDLARVPQLRQVEPADAARPARRG